MKVSVSDPERLARSESGLGRQDQDDVFHRLRTLLYSGIEVTGGNWWGGIPLGAHQCGFFRLAPWRGGEAKGRLAELDFFST